MCVLNGHLTQNTKQQHSILLATKYFSILENEVIKASPTKENKVSVRVQTRRALARAHLPPTSFPRLAVNKTILKPRVTAATGAQYLYVGFSRCNKISRCNTYDIGESNPVPASGLQSASGSKVNHFVHVPTPVDMQNFIQIHARIFEQFC